MAHKGFRIFPFLIFRVGECVHEEACVAVQGCRCGWWACVWHVDRFHSELPSCFINKKRENWMCMNWPEFALCPSA